VDFMKLLLSSFSPRSFGLEHTVTYSPFSPGSDGAFLFSMRPDALIPPPFLFSGRSPLQTLASAGILFLFQRRGNSTLNNVLVRCSPSAPPHFSLIVAT